MAKLSNTDLYYDRVGQGRAMLIMHGGLGLDHKYFRPWLDKLGDSTALIYYDHRANGRSARPMSMDGISHQTWIDDAEELRVKLGLGKIILFGHSYGGFLAQEYALKFGENLAGLILCSTSPAIDYMPDIQANAKARGAKDSLEALEEAFSRPMNEDKDLRSIWIRLLPLYFKNYDPAIGQEMDKETSYSARAWNHANANCLPLFNTLPRLKEIGVATLILGGADDWFAPQEQARRLLSGLPNAKISIFKESGHFPFIEENNEFVKTIGKWMDKLG